MVLVQSFFTSIAQSPGLAPKPFNCYLLSFIADFRETFTRHADILRASVPVAHFQIQTWGLLKSELSSSQMHQKEITTCEQGNYLIGKKSAISSSTKLFMLVIFCLLCGACNDDDLTGIANTTEVRPKLSDYTIFQGILSDLSPSEDFKVYELSTELFSDYAEKQRLIKIPEGYTLTSRNDGLPDFPDGTILVKTFYYLNDKRDHTKGKKIIETRLLIKQDSRWNVATYIWNEDQTDAFLITAGMNKTVNWINSEGKGKVVAYHIPSNRECTSCHYTSGAILPIGPKLRNLNNEVLRNGASINQLTYLYNEGILNQVDHTSVTALPDWQDAGKYTLAQRARAYLDINCAHCHNPLGMASDRGFNLNYEADLGTTNIPDNKNRITEKMETLEMPFIGTTEVHTEGLELIKDYMESL